MAVKLLMTWNIQTGREQEYFEFVVREFIPQMQLLGLEASDAWVTVFGSQPQILVTMKTNTMDSMRQAVRSQEWDQLTDRLLDYVEDFHYKTVAARPGFQL
ncbi:MAG: hypothetical protein H8E28_14990 [Anaerolineae bacterium]|nr:hypothetical protein [Anaerolineae bacterium]